MDIGTNNMSRRSTSDSIIENDENVPDCFDGARELPNSEIPPSNHSISTGSISDLAKDEETGRRHYLKTMKAEQRAKFLGSLAF